MERFFRYGSLELPIQGHDEPFIWGVWVELAPADYARDEDLGEVQGREKEPPYHGVFAVEIPFYEQRTEGLAVFLHERPVGVRPLVTLQADTHVLWSEQQNGIPVQRAEDIIEWFLHGRFK